MNDKAHSLPPVTGCVSRVRPRDRAPSPSESHAARAEPSRVRERDACHRCMRCKLTDARSFSHRRSRIGGPTRRSAKGGWTPAEVSFSACDRACPQHRLFPALGAAARALARLRVRHPRHAARRKIRRRALVARPVARGAWTAALPTTGSRVRNTAFEAVCGAMRVRRIQPSSRPTSALVPRTNADLPDPTPYNAG